MHPSSLSRIVENIFWSAGKNYRSVTLEVKKELDDHHISVKVLEKVSNKKRYSETPVYEYRIKYITKNSLVPSYHYYMAESAEQALGFSVGNGKA